MSNLDLFEPERRSELDQYFTEAWIARRAARWIPRGAVVLEPSCGSGNLVEGLVLAGHPIENVLAFELDPAWAAHARTRFPGLLVNEGDFLKLTTGADVPNTVAASLQNPPYGNDLDLRFVERTLAMLDRTAPACVVAILKTDFEYSDGRAPFWRERARVRRRAMLVERPRFGAHVDGKKQGGAERNYVVLEIVPRTAPRAPGAAEVVIEERWSRTDPESCWTGPIAEVLAT
ncbi:hypothetical protein [Sandaracinus amylolyticus]|uniref:hypothetical protein n=1 Tax=Sandaracinus amylolyticus TaxID=927083 RepID=UPI001F321A21|nr:hypothetical protein [Sandaracinus amylolyticus]UJR81464.1 Hypothetical protein I5071_35230 [Sandaracinus amylolyticus]